MRKLPVDVQAERIYSKRRLRSWITRKPYVENPAQARILKLRIGDNPGPGNLGLSSRVHFFSAACQFVTTFSGGAAAASTVVITNRFPSAVTSYWYNMGPALI